jgi:hypothetical protein
MFKNREFRFNDYSISNPSFAARVSLPEFRCPSFASGARGPFRSLRSLKRTNLRSAALIAIRKHEVLFAALCSVQEDLFKGHKFTRSRGFWAQFPSAFSAFSVVIFHRVLEIANIYVKNHR